MDTRTAHALIRFGLGPRLGEPPPSDPAAWLRGQLRAPDPARFDPAPSSAAGLAAIRDDRRDRPQPGQSRARALYRTHGAQTLLHAIAGPAPFRERLVRFWTNHFTVSLRRGEVAGVAAALVEEAIRPHATGKFEDMVLAVMRHPAMLLYLDNAQSIGPDSPAAAQGRRRGLNENLARECLELHTVTPAAGYSQDDVTALARVLTGWSIDMQAEPPKFAFRARSHQLGAHAVMGRMFPEGEDGGIEALRFLARHPATHRALAAKLVRHFVADSPPPDAVRRIEGTLRDTGGDLGAAAGALIDLPGAWEPGGKLRDPADLVVAAFRALGAPLDPMPNLIGIVAGLGQPLWTAPAPDGWPDCAAAWATPEAMMRRIDWLAGFSARIGDWEPMLVADGALGPLLRAETKTAMARAGSRRDAVALLLSSPEFQRR